MRVTSKEVHMDRRRFIEGMAAAGAVVDRVERPPAARADADRFEVVVGLAVAAAKCGGGQRISFLSLDILRASRLAGLGTLLRWRQVAEASQGRFPQPLSM